MKKDSSHLKQSKIARETAEAIKYLKKRQPLTVQNTQGVDDEQLFSLPSKRKGRMVAENDTANRNIRRDTSNSPSKNTLQLNHVGEKAKFFRNVGAG